MRIVAIDFGTKRTGIAVTDPLQIISSPFKTIPTESLLDFLAEYATDEPIEAIVLGDPKHPDGNPAQLSAKVHQLADKLRKLFPDKNIVLQDESFTSVEAKQIILQSGARKKKRRDKSLVDKVSAALILERFMETKRK